MFAEELTANSSRKRAQEAKTRRLKLKAQQKQQQTKEGVVVHCPAENGVAVVTSNNCSGLTFPASTSTTTTTTTTSGTKVLSAVEHAEEQRKLRNRNHLHKAASIRLQCIIRGFLCRTKLIRERRNELQRKLYDLQKLQAMMMMITQSQPCNNSNSKKKSTLYLPPRQVVSDLLRLYVTLHWLDRTGQIVELLLLPGIQEDASSSSSSSVKKNHHPIAHWDARSLRLLLGCLLEYYYDFNPTTARLESNNTNDATTTTTNLISCIRGIVQLDPSLWQIVWQTFRRSIRTIPSNVEALREKCFSKLETIRNSKMMDLCWEWMIVVDDTKKIVLISQLLSCPLLSWRIRNEETTYWTRTLPEKQLAHMDINWWDETMNNVGDESSSLLISMEQQQCGSTSTQRVLANLLTLPLPRNIVWYDCITMLLQHVPYETFSTQSSVMWVEQKQQQDAPPTKKVPIVLNKVILDQCKLLLVETQVRKVFQPYDTYDETILDQKNTQDIKQEQALQELGTTAAALAVQDAKTAAKWNTSGFAQRLLNHSVMGRLLLSRNNKNNAHNSHAILAPPLPNTSNNSKRLAMERVENTSPNGANTLELFLAVVRTYAVIVSRWSGDGSIDVMRHNNNSSSKMITKPQPQEQSVKSLMNVLGFSTKFLQMSWTLIQTDLADQIRSIHHDNDFALKYDRTSSSTPIRLRTVHSNDGGCVLYLFLCVFSHCLIVTDDAELHEMNRPIPLFQIRRCIQLLKSILYRAACVDTSPTSSHDNKGCPFGLALITASARTMRDLYDRSSRRPLCTTKLWIVDSLLELEINKAKSHGNFTALLETSPILRVCPYMVPFKRRLKLFERLVSTLRVEIQGENSANPFHNNPLKPGIPIRITRGRLLEDGLITMNNLGTNLRQRICVNYYNQAGTKEQGIDAGGLFKEFWTDLCAIAFDPNYALFRVTESSSGVGNCLYPNPSSSTAHGDTHTTLYAFLGRILGKALFEGITIRPIFSHFTLSFLRGDYNFLHMLADLSTIEPQLYNNLMFLKTYDGDASDLALTFTVTTEEFGGTREISLLPNGADMEVTNSNKHLYIGLVAKYYVYDRIRDQSEAMTKGLLEVIDRSWIQIFNEPELQVLISGASDGKLDVEDMRQHCHYAGGYSAIDPSILRFWSVVASLNEKHQSALLRFITSCERPPPLGFRTLNPPLTIQRVGIFRDGERLPTASTCFNVLKLPTYSSEKVMRERLIYAIESGAGFELS